MRAVFLGPPGAGKGTQAKLFCERLGLCHISTGDLLRQAVADGTQPGLKAKEFMDKGELVPDALVLNLLEKRLAMPDCSGKGYVLDGYPRNIEQAKSLDAALEKLKSRLDAVAFIDAPRAMLIERLSGRRACPSCGAGFHVRTMPPKKTGVCDSCGSKLVQRADDRPATIENRLKVYEKSTKSLIDYYETRGILRTIPGGGEVEEIAALLYKQLKGAQ